MSLQRVCASRVQSETHPATVEHEVLRLLVLFYSLEGFARGMRMDLFVWNGHGCESGCEKDVQKTVQTEQSQFICLYRTRIDVTSRGHQA